MESETRPKPMCSDMGCVPDPPFSKQKHAGRALASPATNFDDTQFVLFPLN